MKRILAFCFFPAFVPPANGGQQRLFHFYRTLSRWHHVTLLTSTHLGGSQEVIQHGLGFVEKRIPKDAHFARQYEHLEAASSGGDLSGPALAACGHLPTPLHQAYLEAYEGADLIIHDSPFTVDYDVFAGLDGKIRVYNAYNCETDLYRQLHPGQNSAPLHELVRDVERRLLDHADLVLYCNPDDLSRFQALAPGADFTGLYTPHGMTPCRFAAEVAAPGPEGLRAVFMGSAHPPNVEAARFIVHTLAPALPGIRFEIIGSCLKEGNYPPNVRRHGLVEDERKQQILRQSHLALNPMTSGSGANVKVLEYFAHALPVLSTPFGMRGIEAEPGRDYLAASPEAFVDVLREIAAHPESIQPIGKRGQKLAQERYTWEAIVRPVAERLESLCRQSPAQPATPYVLALNDYDSFATVGGGGTRTRGLYEAVRDWAPVVFLCFSSDGTLAARREAGITIITLPKTEAHLADELLVNHRYHVSANDILASRHCLANPWLCRVYDLLRKAARCIVVEHCYLAGLPLSRGDRFVHSSQNNETQLKRRLLESHPLKSQLLAEVERLERMAIEQAGLNIAVSEEDAASFTVAKRSVGPILVVRNGAASPLMGEEVQAAKKALSEKIGQPAVVFLGSAHMPNVEAAKYITERIASRCPNVRFHLLGSVCATLSKVPANVTLWGVVDENTKSAVLQSCALAINPMQAGGGSNVKVADYLANGLFVISTEWGLRGYPETVAPHVAVCPLEAFPEEIQAVIANPKLHDDPARASRHALFEQEFSMRGLARRFVEALRDLEQPRQRVLYVAYRYTAPPLGGAEVNIEKFIAALARSGDFEIDVIAPEISGIHNHYRFGERYDFDASVGAPIDMPRVRFARFPVEPPNPDQIFAQLRQAWSVQPGFERAVDAALRADYRETGLTWGWSHPEGEGGDAARWAFTECALFLQEAALVQLHGYAEAPCVTTALGANELLGGPWPLEGRFSLGVPCPAGELRLLTSAPCSPTDPRPLGLRLSRIEIAGKKLDLSQGTLIERSLPTLPAERVFDLLDQAARQSREPAAVRLTDGRGPWSPGLERYLAEQLRAYDLVVAHNNVFRPAVLAMAEAKKQGVPAILIPHAHLDDDFYHFPDGLESVRNATLVLAAPKAACTFLAEKGGNVRYLPAGYDAEEKFSPADAEAFRRLHPSARPFLLVLGRKAQAKGYPHIIKAVEQLNREGLDLDLVLIGPDDDGLPVPSAHAVYLGRQPRAIVRGALMSCLALCNMSSSESFGIVLLEAWRAGKPVIANKQCAAFHDLARHDHEALLVGREDLPAAIRKLWEQPQLRQRLAENGKAQLANFAWEKVAANFVAECRALIRQSHATPSS
ncbi:MAG: glycosyltransferase [Azovibrio sp.]|uniref:glycosyltransferase n=2 Tax=Azovibrio sp. TaxID=1872673 RepID=UPI003C72C008